MATTKRNLDKPAKFKGWQLAPQPNEPAKAKPAGRVWVHVVVMGFALGSIIMLSTPDSWKSVPDRSAEVVLPDPPAALTPVSRTPVVNTDRRKVSTLDELLQLTPVERVEVDIARVNLLVAEAALGTGDLDIDAILRTLDRWAGAVAFDTDRHLYKFYADPASYGHSEGYFRILTLITVLQQDCGVRYNPERITTPDFTNPGDLFIHGMVGGEGGTCVSMPVLYTAIARRLGYPVSLVTTKGHVFARWEDDLGERFNIEATNQGLTVHTDEHYRGWPMPVTMDEIERFGFLKTLDADESLAVFLCSMGHALADTGRPQDAVRAYRLASALDPDNALYGGFVSQVLIRSGLLEQRLTRNGHGRVDGPLAEFRRIQELNRRNNRLNNPPMPTAPVPYPRPDRP